MEISNRGQDHFLSGGNGEWHRVCRFVGLWDLCHPANRCEEWRFATNYPVSSSPVIGATGTIFVGSEDDYLYAINPNGQLAWSFATGGPIWPSPAINVDGTVYVGSWDNKLYAVNSDGTQKWAFTTGSIIDSSPLIGADGTIFIGSADWNLYAVNPDGSQQWAFPEAAAINSSPAFGTDYIGTGMYTLYVGSEDGMVNAIQLATYTLVPSAGPNGTISPNTPQTAYYGMNFDFNATPNLGYQVDSWIVDGNVVQMGGNWYDFDNISANHTIQVTFTPLTYTVVPMASTNGTITPSTTQTVDYGTSLTFTAVPNTCYMASLVRG